MSNNNNLINFYRILGEVFWKEDKIYTSHEISKLQ